MCDALPVIMNGHERATQAERAGIYVALVEGALFAVLSAMHFGARFRLGESTFSAPFFYPAAFTEAAIALALLLAVLMPGPGQARASRVLVAQMMALLGMFAIQVGMMRGPALTGARNEIFYAVLFGLSIMSIMLVGSSAFRRRRRFAH